MIHVDRLISYPIGCLTMISYHLSQTDELAAVFIACVHSWNKKKIAAQHCMHAPRHDNICSLWLLVYRTKSDMMWAEHLKALLKQDAAYGKTVLTCQSKWSWGVKGEKEPEIGYTWSLRQPYSMSPCLTRKKRPQHPKYQHSKTGCQSRQLGGHW